MVGPIGKLVISSIDRSKFENGLYQRVERSFLDLTRYGSIRGTPTMLVGEKGIISACAVFGVPVQCRFTTYL